MFRIEFQYSLLLHHGRCGTRRWLEAEVAPRRDAPAKSGRRRQDQLEIESHIRHGHLPPCLESLESLRRRLAEGKARHEALPPRLAGRSDELELPRVLYRSTESVLLLEAGAPKLADCSKRFRSSVCLDRRAGPEVAGRERLRQCFCRVCEMPRRRSENKSK